MKYPIISGKGKDKRINRAIVLSFALLPGLVAFIGREAHAVCLSEDVSLSIEEDTAPEDEAFVSSSPASAETEFKLEVDLTNVDFANIDLFPEQAEEQSSRNDSDDSDAELRSSGTNGEASSSNDLENDSDLAEGDDPEADNAPEPWTISREDWLNAAANDVNNCF